MAWMLYSFKLNNSLGTAGQSLSSQLPKGSTWRCDCDATTENTHLTGATRFIFLPSSALLPAENVLLVLRQTAYAYTNADVYDRYGMGDKPQYTNQAM